MVLQRCLILLVSFAALTAWNGTAAEPGGADGVGVAAAVSASMAAANRDEVRSAEADQRLERAERHMVAGKQSYFRGDLQGARREFDAAIDALLNAPENLPDHRRIERKLDEISDLVYRFDIENLGAGQTSEALAFDQAPIDQIRDMTFPVDQSLLPKVNSELQQTASAIPLELADPVLSYIHYFSTDYGRRVLLGGFKRAGRYKPMIQRILAEEGVPQELIYLAQAESGFLPRAISTAHAMGMWQFIAGTGQIYSLTRTSSVDERFDPEKATRAAARMLKDMYQRYGDWYLAMAAYNCGAGNVDKAVERTGYADYWELLKRNALPKETSHYVPIILAMTIMAKNPQDYGLDAIEEDEPLEYDTVHLEAATNLSLIADAAQQPVSAIRDMNPALLNSLAPSGYDLRVPKGVGDSTLASIHSVPAPNRNSWRLHHVTSGESLEAIARQYHLQAERIVSVNRGSETLDAGEVLLIPAAYHEPPTAVKARTRSLKSLRSGVALTARSSQANRAASSTHHLAPAALHRRAAVRTASINR